MFFGLNKGDLILIAAIGLVIIAMILIPRLLFEDESGIKAVIVTVDGTEVFREPMPQNTSGATRDLTWSSKIVTPAHSIKPLWQQPVLDHH